MFDGPKVTVENLCGLLSGYINFIAGQCKRDLGLSSKSPVAFHEYWEKVTHRGRHI